MNWKNLEKKEMEGDQWKEQKNSESETENHWQEMKKTVGVKKRKKKKQNYKYPSS